MPYKAAIFDLDGTLTTSLDAFRRSEIEAFGHVGVTITIERFADINRYGVRQTIERWTTEVDPTRHDELHRKRRELSHLYLTESMRFDDVEPTVEHLRESGLHSGIVTSARYSHIDAINTRSRILDLLPILAAREDVGDKTKPDPEGLIIAYKKLELTPADCLYIGDAPFDVEAADAIGMHSALIDRGHLSPDERVYALKYATYHLQTLRELVGIIE